MSVHNNDISCRWRQLQQHALAPCEYHKMISRSYQLEEFADVGHGGLTSCWIYGAVALTPVYLLSYNTGWLTHQNTPAPHTT